MNDFVEAWLRGESEQQDAITVKRVYIDINGGSLIDGTIFSQIMYWHGYDKSGKTRLRIKKDGELWLAKSYDDWWEECRIRPATARKSITRMVDSGLLIKVLYKFNGNPTIHVRLNWEEFIKRVRFTKGGSNGSVLRGQKEMTLEVRTLTETTTDTTNNKETENEKEGVLPSADPSSGVRVKPSLPEDLHSFEKFWELYPKKVDKKNSSILWKKEKLHLREKEILTGLREQIAVWKKDQTERKYIISPLRFLKREKWLDETDFTGLDRKQKEDIVLVSKDDFLAKAMDRDAQLRNAGT